MRKEECQLPPDLEAILYCERPKSKHHTPMPMADRAAQFAPFAALTGHSQAMEETARRTTDFVEISEAVKERLDLKLQQIVAALGQKKELEAEIEYFVPDERKQGGAYEKKMLRIKKVDTYERALVDIAGCRIPFHYIRSIELSDL